MSAETKRREILQMLANGSITAAEAGELLSQLKHDSAPPVHEEPVQASEPEPVEAEAVPGKRARWLHVKVQDMASGRSKVSVKIPIALARIGLRMGAKFAPEVNDFNWDEIMSELTTGGSQSLVEVQDQEDGELVQIYLT